MASGEEWRMTTRVLTWMTSSQKTHQLNNLYLKLRNWTVKKNPDWHIPSKPSQAQHPERGSPWQMGALKGAQTERCPENGKD